MTAMGELQPVTYCSDVLLSAYSGLTFYSYKKARNSGLLVICKVEKICTTSENLQMLT